METIKQDFRTDFDLDGLPEELKKLIPVQRISNNLADIDHDADQALHVYFDSQPKFSQAKSDDAGRPIFDQVTYVFIHIPGGKSSIIHEITDKNKKYWTTRFPKQWAIFESQSVVKFSGTPIDELPFMTDARKAEYKMMRILTVEQLSTLSDGQLDTMGMGARKEKEKAELWLDKSKAVRVAETAIEEKNELLNEIEKLKAQLKADNEIVAAPKAKKVKRGATKKVTVTPPEDASLPPQEDDDTGIDDAIGKAMSGTPDDGALEEIFG